MRITSVLPPIAAIVLLLSYAYPARVTLAVQAPTSVSAPLCARAPWFLTHRQAQALQPQFRPLLAHLGAAPYYQLTFTPNLAAHLLSVDESFCYTNSSSDTLHGLALRLYPNYPVDSHFRMSHLAVDGRPTTASLDTRDLTFAMLSLSAPLLPGQSVEVQMSVTGSLPLAATDAPNVPAMRLTDGGALGQFPHYLTLAWAYAQVGVFADHRWSHTVQTGHTDSLFAPIAFFDATVVLPRTFRLVSSGITLSSEITGQASRRFHLVTGPVRDLTIEASPQLAQIAEQVGGVRIESAYVPNQSGTALAEARTSLRLAEQALTLASKTFSPYPYAKLTLAEAPIAASGLQWSTLIQMATGPYGLRHAASTEGVPLFNFPGPLIAHEVSHQWWYGLVGNDQVDQGYLSEGLATLSEIVIPVAQARALRPALAEPTWSELQAGSLDSVLTRYWQAGGKDVVIDQPSHLMPPGAVQYTNYDKASAFFLIYASRFGRAALFDFLHRYASENEFGIATLDSLEHALIEAAPGHAAAVALLVTEWFRQPGLARVINVHNIPLASTPAWLPVALAPLEAASNLHPISLRPEVELQLGQDPIGHAIRTYRTQQNARSTINRIIATLQRSGWALASPLSRTDDFAQVQLGKAGHYLDITITTHGSLPPSQQRVLGVRLPAGSTLVTIQD